MDLPIDDLIRELGFEDADVPTARCVLEEAGLTNPRKSNIAARKRGQVEDALARHFERLCRGCFAAPDPGGREPVQVEGNACERCGGSDGRRAATEMVERCQEAGVRRLVFVGGSPSFRQELDRLVGGALELRLVDGTANVNRARARQDIDWADLVVICGSTELAHRVSNCYTTEPLARGKYILTARRGIAAIAGEVTRSDLLARSGA